MKLPSVIMPRIQLFFPFRYCDPLTGEWIYPLQRAQLHEIADLHSTYEITGSAEFREVPISA